MTHALDLDDVYLPGSPLHVTSVHLEDGRSFRSDRTPAETFDPARVGWNDVVEKLEACRSLSGLDVDTAAVVQTISELASLDRIETLVALLR